MGKDRTGRDLLQNTLVSIGKMALIKPVHGILPRFGKNCYLADNATVVGDVVMGDDCSVWFQAVVRGDVHYIRMGNKVNIQDGAVIHCTYQRAPVNIGNNVSIGHRAIVHGCTLHDNVLVGMGAILMTEILSYGANIARTVKKFVFQPRNYPAILRHWLYENGFHIVHESLVREGRHLCEIIVAKPGKAEDSDSGNVSGGIFGKIDEDWSKDDIRWEIPPWYGFMDDPLAGEFLHRKLERERRVRREVQKRLTPDTEHLARLESRIHYLKDLVEMRESDDRL